MHRTGQGNATVLRPHHQQGPAAAVDEIGIVLYPGAQAACVHGLTDLFEIAANIARDRQRGRRLPLRGYALAISALPRYRTFVRI